VKEIVGDVERWRERGEKVAIATVVATRRSAPRPVGAKFAVSEQGEMCGSVSGGCVENDVAVQAREVIESGKPRLLSYGITDDQALGIGLPCGGEIDVFLERFGGAPPIVRGTSYVIVAGEDVGSRWHDDSRSSTHLRQETARTVFVESVAPPPRLVAVGAGDIAEAMCALARPLGWHSVVVDPRAGLATRDRVPSADEIIVEWPENIEVDEDTALVSLVHEERLDLPALRRGVEGGAFYVGALGSRRAQEKRREKLGEVADSIHGPVGLDLGGETPAEIALEIMAELVAARKNGSAA
jgi:xanthine dehydrogenase accessory factor